MRGRIRDPEAPATKDQLRYARALGIEIPDNVTKGAISELIDKAAECRTPTNDQLVFARALDLVVPEGATFNMVSDLLSAEVRIRSINAMATNEALRAGNVIMHANMPYTITFIGGRRSRYVADLKPLRAGIKGYGKKTVMILTIATARKVDVDALRHIFQ